MKKLLITAISVICISGIFAQEKRDKHFETFKQLDIYNAIWRELDINYVDTIDHKRVSEVGINAMLRQLDPYTTYIPAEEEENLKTMTTGMYAGIGAVIQKHGEYVVISEPRFGLAAQKNGLLAGDKIIEVDGEDMRGKSVGYVSSRLRGVAGTTIKLKLRRYNQKRTFEKTFQREAIHIESIDYYGILPNQVGYISLSDFTDKAYQDFRTALMELKEKGIKSLVIDLRNNGGGLVSEAVNIASLFLPKGTTVVSMKGNTPSSERVYKTPFMPQMPDIPISVIINENSASTSEILAGAFQDLDRATIVGQRSYGKGLVQTIRQLPHYGYLKLTNAKYYLPSGRCVQSGEHLQQGGERLSVIPDSLTNAFKTSKGRTVRDQSGVTPDIMIENAEGNYISYYLYAENLVFDFATQYYFSHENIASPSEFKLTDSEYQEFVEFARSRNFTYTKESEKMLEHLQGMVKTEGYAEQTDSIFEALKPFLKADIDRDFKEFRTDIQEMIEAEIIKRYYYQKGVSEYMLRHDDWLDKAIEALQ